MTTPNIEELHLLAQTLEFSDAVRCSIQRAADLLQSQAERIAELESLNELAVKQAETLVKQHDTLRAQLAAIAANEPVAYRWVWKSKPWDIEGWCYTNTPPNHPELQEIEKLFTRPMPTNRLTELKLLMLTIAYEQGVGKGIQRRDCNPYAADTDEHAAWKLGYEEGLDKPMPAQDVEDAERYRWLREQHWSTDTIAVVLNPKQAVKLGYVCPSDSLLDETIDAAIAKGAK